MDKTIIIAEAGINHNGSLDLARQLIDAAAEAGVDYVKFQTFKSENLVSKSAKKAAYQKRNLQSSDDSQFTMLKKLELSPEDHYELFHYCSGKAVKFFSTAFDLESIDFLSSFNSGMWKVPSGEITNYPYLKKIAQFHEPVILSTGMSTMEDVSQALSVLTDFGVSKHQITVLHCNTEYPTPMEDVNLRAMITLQKKFEVQVGYSDHTPGIEVPIAAVALGARIIEKHFTLNRYMEGPDHKASLEPAELRAMVKAIRNIEKALGSEKKQVTPSEQKNRVIARKSIVAAKPIAKGEFFTEENLTVKRPGNGISPMRWEEVIGKCASKSYVPDELIILP